MRPELLRCSTPQRAGSIKIRFRSAVTCFARGIRGPLVRRCEQELRPPDGVNTE